MVEAERAQLIERHLELARKIAGVMHRRVRDHIELDELQGWANEGLTEAAASYDAKRGTAFTTWAWYRMQGTIIDGIRRNSSLPRRVWRQIQTLRAASEHLENLGERDAGAAARGANPKHGAEALAQIKDSLSAIRTMYMTSLDALTDQGFDPEAVEDESAAERVDSNRMGRKLRLALSRLPPKERELMKKFYYEGKSLLEAGAELGMSKSWASRLHSQAVEKLRAIVDAEM